MLNANVLFGNLFRSEKITPERLSIFGIAVLAALQLANTNGLFDAIIALLTTSLDNLQNELSNVDTNLTDQKIETKTVDQFLNGFVSFMSDNEAFIARALGGYTSAGFLAFYPNKQTEYSKVTKTTMQTLTDRVQRAAKKYNDKLDPEMSAQLQAFSPDFKKQYATQQGQINTVKSDRTERSTAFVQLQLALTTTVLTVGATYPGNIAKCSSFFPFRMLYPQGKKKIYTLAGKLAIEELKMTLNMILTKNVEITLKNTGDAANYAFWLAASVNEPMPEDAYIINVGSDALRLKASEMPGYDGIKTFYMVKNLSNINECAYEISFIGTRKKIANAKVTTEVTELQVANG